MTTPDEPAPPDLEYESFPVRDDWPRSLALVAIVSALAVGIAASFESAGWGAFGAGVLVACLLRYFVPTRYVLDARGVTERFLGRERFRAWSEVRALYPHRDGVHLSPFAAPSRLDPFRGLYVRFAPGGGGDPAAVLAFLERHVHVRPAA